MAAGRKVGIIANPASGKDIRRLVAYGSVFDNEEKVNIVRRILLGLEAAGVDEVLIMPDTYGIGARALDGLSRRKLRPRVDIIQMEIGHSGVDSTLAARLLKEQGVGAIVVLGGDGTCRAVAKGCGDVPLVPVSTGTNNVFPMMVEGTVAGLAAGLVATGFASAVRRAKKLDVIGPEGWRDLALVDAVVTEETFVAARALWDMERVRAIICTRCEPDTIGLSAVAGCLHPVSPTEAAGLYLELGDRKTAAREVLAPVAPGLFATVPVNHWRRLAFGESVTVDTGPRLIALDGEREVLVQAGEEIKIVLSDEGPYVVDTAQVLRQAQAAGFFVSYSTV
ncbi:MAG: ATP-NAD kinase [Firmicutes bacterium]|jgi:predicted polyphosphate/ATP-dependent NAD kinase|nr:ATP-NAD kinase [Bacillota bacterium]